MIRVFPLAVGPQNEEYLIVTGDDREFVIMDLGDQFPLNDRFEMYTLDVNGMPWGLVKDDWVLMEGLDGTEFHTCLCQLNPSAESAIGDIQ